MNTSLFHAGLFRAGLPGADELEDRLRDAGVRAAGGAQDLAEALAAIRGRGSSEDGRVKAQVRADGTVLGLTIDPHVLRDGSEVVATTVTEAVNAAAADARALADSLTEQSAASYTRAAAEVQRDFENILGQVMTDVTRSLDRLG